MRNNFINRVSLLNMAKFGVGISGMPSIGFHRQDIMEAFHDRGFSSWHSKSLLGNERDDHFAFKQYALRFAKLLGIEGGVATLADIGCGPGQFGIVMSQLLEGGKMYFNDISASMIQRLKENLSASDWNANVMPEIVLGDGVNIEQMLGGVKLDGIFSRHVVHHMQPMHEFFEGAYNMLCPGAKLVFSFIGNSTFNFINNKEGNGLFQNGFLSRILQSSLYELPYLLGKLSCADIIYLIDKGVLVQTHRGLVLSKKSLLPQLDKWSVLSELHRAGIPQSAISYFIISEIHTVGFKQAYSEALGTIPIPGIWEIFELLDKPSRFSAVRNIYDRAFPGDKNQTIILEDPIFVVTKQGDLLHPEEFGTPAQFEQSKLSKSPDKQLRIARESFDQSAQNILRIAALYGYETWRVRGFDMQMAGVNLENAPQDLTHATLILQANNYTFTVAHAAPLSGRQAQIVTPYSMRTLTKGLPADALLTYEGKQLFDFETFKLLQIMFEPSLWYFAFKEKDGSFKPIYLIVNPYRDCYFRCKPCSRIPYFHDATRGYQGNTQKIIHEVQSSVSKPNDVKFINIITGSQRDAEADIRMFKYVIDLFRNAGFTDATFGMYSHNITEREQMERLANLGVISFCATMEVTDDKARIDIYGKKGKGRLSFDDFVDMLKKAEKYFDWVSTTIILGHESSESLKSNATRLAAQTGFPFNHFIPRIFLKRQYEIIHPEAKERGLEYYCELSRFLEEEINRGRRTFGQFFDETFGIEKFKTRFRS